MNGRRNILLIAGGLLLFAIATTLMFVAFSRSGKSSIDIITAPSDAVIVVDGKKLSRGTNYISPGTYTINVSRKEFIPIELELVVLEGDNQPFPVLLTPATEKGWDITSVDPAFLEVEKAAGEKANLRGIEFEKLNPIVANLPYRSGLFNIDYRLKDGSNSEIILIITVHELERELPQEQIRKWGFDTANFEIEYRGWW